MQVDTQTTVQYAISSANGNIETRGEFNRARHAERKQFALLANAAWDAGKVVATWTTANIQATTNAAE